ncbi:MAG: radical SAM protein [Rhizobiales bacterium]|nr:radical SAM protein [Hyphomicrobiales bacterium]
MPTFHVHLIRPTRYDEEGYPLQWWRSLVPSNSLACLVGVVEEAIARRALGDVEIRIHARDEIHADVDVDGMIAAARRGERLFVGLVGVQTNQYPRALDIARRLRAENVPVCIGGFHVSGVLAMLKQPTPELQEALDLGVSLFAGEAEDGRIDEVLRDAWAGALKPVYDFLKHAPNLAGAPVPINAAADIARGVGHYASFDLGRGCPFECTFCTIINVQGRKSRFRTPDDLEKIVRDNAARGVTRFFMTDDNFARNKHWEPLIDRLLALRAEGLKITFAVQVDTLAHRIPRFIDKVCRAGAEEIFIGLENINSDSLEATKKRQNRIEEYREMFLTWKAHRVFIVCGYIIGFPNDTRESILRDIETIKRTLPIDALYMNFLTPLPGSEDHRGMVQRGEWMEPDLSKFTLSHRVTHHPRMSDAEWEAAYRDAYASFYDEAHLETIFRRRFATKWPMPWTTLHRVLLYRESVRVMGVSKLEGGVLRIRRRRQRKAGLPLEPALAFYPRVAWRLLRENLGILRTYFTMRGIVRRVRADPLRRKYRDEAIAPLDAGAQDDLIAAARVTEHAEKRMRRAAASGA